MLLSPKKLEDIQFDFSDTTKNWILQDFKELLKYNNYGH